MAYTLPRGAGRAAKMARALYMPMSLLELEVETRPGRSMQRIREAHTWIPLPYMQSDPIRASLAMFLSEFLGSVLRNNEPQPELFAYIARSIHLLDRIGNGLGNFHLCFLIGLTSYMGITPNTDGYRPGTYFDMQEGIFVAEQPIFNTALQPNEAAFMIKLLRMNFANLHLYRFSRGERNIILDRIITYYSIHLSGMGQLSSPAVLHALFD
jgi:DNA repair protein RecO (recombination protein O)